MLLILLMQVLFINLTDFSQFFVSFYRLQPYLVHIFCLVLNVKNFGATKFLIRFIYPLSQEVFCMTNNVSTMIIGGRSTDLENWGQFPE